MKVILLADVKKLGKKGDTVKVADGYGMNFLVKNKLAVLESDRSKKVLEKQKEEQSAIDEANKLEAIKLKDSIEALTLEFNLNSGKDGKTFGSISTKQVVEQLRDKHSIKVDKRKFLDSHTIGALGYSKLKIELYKGVIATITVHLTTK